MAYTVSIAGVAPDPEVYAGLVKATAYIGGSFRPEAARWRGLAEDDKERTLVDATRYVDERSWDGDATLSGTTLQFPRSGGAITDDAATQLAIVEKAVCELAMAIAADPTLPTAIDAGSNIKVLDADGARIEFFAPTSAVEGTAPRMPAIVQRLLGRYSAPANAGALPTGGGASFGTDGESAFDDCDELDRSRPY